MKDNQVVPSSGVGDEEKNSVRAGKDLAGVDTESPRPALDGNALLMEERWRQKTEEGWTTEHDEGHDSGDLARAADCYRRIGNGSLGYSTPQADQSEASVPQGWPWARQWWKPKTRLRNLVRAGALYQAEIDRLCRQRQQVAEEIDALMATVNAPERDAES